MPRNGASYRKCFVADCKSRSDKGTKSFFSIPKDPVYREVFRVFSRQGPEYNIGKTATICGDHFDSSCLVKKNKYLALKKGSVPTILVKDLETIEVEFDHSEMKYPDEELFERPSGARAAIEQPPEQNKNYTIRCFVVGCNSYRNEEPVSCFTIPDEPTLQDVYLTFSRRGSEYVLKPGTRICSEHFDPSCLERRKTKTLLSKNSVPTIYKRGDERVEVTFDWSVMHYLEEDTLLKPAYDKERELEELHSKRYARREQIKNLCCICLYEDHSESDLIELSKFKDFSIQPIEYLRLIGIEDCVGPKLSSFVCEECFESILSFDGFKTRSKSAQTMFTEELKDLDAKIEKIQGYSIDENEEYIETTPHSPKANLIIERNFKHEEKFEDSGDFSDGYEYIEDERTFATDFKEETIFVAGYDGEPLDQEVKTEILSEEEMIEECIDQDSDYNNDNDFKDDSDYDPNEEEIAKSVKKVTKNVEKSNIKSPTYEKKTYKKRDKAEIEKDKAERFANDVIRKGQKSARIAFECFLCKLKFAGKLTFEKHNCSVKQMYCPVETCDMTFRKLTGYMTHTSIVHKYPKLSRQLCYTCNISRVCTHEEFRQHRQECSGKEVDESMDGLDASKLIEEEKGKNDSSYFSEEVVQNGQKSARMAFQCFFCKLKYAGKTTFKSHECSVKELICPVESCGKKFIAQSGYNSHTTIIHKLPKLCRQLCTTCNVSLCCTEDEFKQHRQICTVQSANNVRLKTIECQICGKICINAKALAAHTMFHNKKKRTRMNKTSSTEKNLMCEACGKSFAKPRNLVDHMKTHEAPKVEEGFACDKCGKLKKSRIHLAKHMRTVHYSQPVSCDYCGKVYKNNTALSAHMLYHTESRRIHYCDLCPDKPPWWTAVALRRHQESHHGYGPGYQCDQCECFYTTHKGLVGHIRAKHKNS